MRSHPRLTAVMALAVVVRAALIPVTHGQDFVVWDLASRGTLAGNDVYAHHPAYPGGPYAYVPLFLDIELLPQWLAQHTGVPFTVLGKLPIVAADLAAGVLLAAAARAHGAGDRGQALASGLFVLNPLVLYNGAFYGRFDSVCVALLLGAVVAHMRDGEVSRRVAVLHALAVGAKTFPIAIAPWLMRRGWGAMRRVVVAGVVIVGGLSLPYILHAPHAYLADLFHNGDVLAGSLSWQVVLRGHLTDSAQLGVSDVLLIAFAVAAVGLAWVDDMATCCAAATLLFLVLSKVVVEQYLLWPMPFLVLLVLRDRSRPAAFLLGLLTAVGMLVNPYIHPLGREPWGLDVVLAVTIAACLPRLVAGGRNGGAGGGSAGSVQNAGHGASGSHPHAGGGDRPAASGASG